MGNGNPGAVGTEGARVPNTLEGETAEGCPTTKKCECTRGVYLLYYHMQPKT